MSPQENRTKQNTYKKESSLPSGDCRETPDVRPVNHSSCEDRVPKSPLLPAPHATQAPEPCRLVELPPHPVQTAGVPGSKATVLLTDGVGLVCTRPCWPLRDRLPSFPGPPGPWHTCMQLHSAPKSPLPYCFCSWVHFPPVLEDEDTAIYAWIVCAPGLRTRSSWDSSLPLLCLLPGTWTWLANQTSFLHRLGCREAQSQICDPWLAMTDSHEVT